ncbi:MAG: hypothetical protein AB1651_04750 [Pseudomonadota bacterium]
MGDVDSVADLIEEFLTGARPAADRNRAGLGRVATTWTPHGRAAPCALHHRAGRQPLLPRPRGAVPAHHRGKALGRNTMSGETFYHEGNRGLQDRFESRRIAFKG